MIVDAVIPVAGLGTRLLPATRSQPKEMLPVLDKPVVQYVVEELVRAGIARVLFVTGRRKRAIEDHFDLDPELERAIGAGPLIDPRTELQILYTRQMRPAGLGDALRCGEGFAGRHGVVVALGDAIIEPVRRPAAGIVARLIDAYENHAADAVLAVAEVAAESVSRYGIVVAGSGMGVGPDGIAGAMAGEPELAPAPAGAGAPATPIEVLDVLEKPDPDLVPSRLAVMGRYVLGPAVFAALREAQPDASGEVQLTDALRGVLRSGGRVLALALADGERRHDVGTIEGYCTTFLEYALRDPRLGPALRVRARALLDGEP
ncbi:MAG: UTP--glucose-1-phosphate uridylyltransferase [Solirubrobacteraceae bacterium]